MNKNTTTTLNGQTFIMGADPYTVTADPDHTSIGWKLVSSNSQLTYEQEQKIQRLDELAAEMINVIEGYYNLPKNRSSLDSSLRKSTIMSILESHMKAVKFLTFKY